MSNKFDFMGDVTFLAQMAHGLAGALSIFACCVLFGLTGMWVGLVVGTILVALKEFWFDLKYEENPKQTLSDSLLDFAFYLVGGGVGLGLGYLAIALHRLV